MLMSFVLAAQASTTTEEHGVFDIATIAIPALISIFGFVVTYLLTKGNFTREIGNMQKSKILEQMATMPLEILDLFDAMVATSKTKAGVSKLMPDVTKIYAKIFAYGSDAATTILSKMQNESKDGQNDSCRVLAYYALLAMQIKYDLSGVAINPSKWLKIRLTDYEQKKSQFRTANNELVKEMGLQKGFLIPENE